MAHFAELDDNNVVLQVIKVNNEDIIDPETGLESEEVGKAYLSYLPGRWIQTWYEGAKRKRYAGQGYSYDPEADVFIAPQPYPSWTLDENFDWVPPVPMPEDQPYGWNEETQTWDPLILHWEPNQ